MQKKKNIRLIISLTILLIVSVGFYWLSNRSTSEGVDKNIFKVKDLKSIDKVVIQSKTENISLKVEGNRWKINDKFYADSNLIDVLFATLQQAEPKRPVAASLKDSLSKVLEDGIKVSLFAGEVEEKNFFVGGNKNRTQAYFKKPGDATPYIMVIPGYRVYTSGIFELDENGWRDKLIFNFNWRNFKSLEATFPDQPTQNFKASFIDRYFGIEGIASVDTTRLNTYLDDVSLLKADRFVSKDSLHDDNKPMMVIDVIDIADRHYQLSLYASKYEQGVYGKLASGEVVFFKPRILTQIFKTRKYFIKGA